MAEGKKGFLMYADQIHLFENLEDDEAGRLAKHLFRYVNDLHPEGDKITKIAFEPIKQQLKRDLKSWEDKSLTRSEIGKIGGLKSGESRRKQKEAIASITKQSEANEADNVNDNDNVNEKKDKGSDKSLTLLERQKLFMNQLTPFVKEFSKETVRAFFDYWTEHNHDGKKMRFEMQKVFDCKKRLTTWKSKEKDFKKPSELISKAVKPKKEYDHTEQ